MPDLEFQVVEASINRILTPFFELSVGIAEPAGRSRVSGYSIGL
jgi:hypothetical protein